MRWEQETQILISADKGRMNPESKMIKEALNIYQNMNPAFPFLTQNLDLIQKRNNSNIESRLEPEKLESERPSNAKSDNQSMSWTPEMQWVEGDFMRGTLRQDTVSLSNCSGYEE